jgi:chemotaxis protein MotA
MMLEGVISILEGLNPRMVETKLRGYLATNAKKEAGGEKAVSPAEEEQLEHAQ